MRFFAVHTSRFKLMLLVFLVVALAVTACGGNDSTAASPGIQILVQARQAKALAEFTKATGLYRQARTLLTGEGKNDEALECLNSLRDIQLISAQYPYSLDETRTMLAAAFPQVPPQEREAWITQGKLESITIDGKPRFFSDVISNVKFRNVDLFRQDAKMYGVYEYDYKLLKQIADAGPGPDPWQPFIRPISYTGTGMLAIPRAKLPAGGILKIWFPIPVVTAPQANIHVLSITPTTYVKGSPSIDQDIGLIYMEVLLGELTQDLNIVIRFTFDHYEQWFQIDPERVGTYDRRSDLYLRYTASYGNIAITDEIRRTAQTVIGSETNPYRAAKKLYDYILATVTYSFMPHLALWPRGEPESVYVHRNRSGDCGAQSMYFSALCRSVGIPARTTGGWQLFKGNFSGHFWAEFYLPNYGWIPVDPTAADLVDYLTGVSDQDRKAFHDFFFGNQDHYRCNVQKDVDVPLIPPSPERVFMPMAIQYPVAACDTLEDDPGLMLMDYWSTTVSVN
ncbi:MAG: transglutaminase domain-containing protein [Deltaproteobacteria bacterium]|nr:transglutaminase domain-containing protein [Deltaproteobacteria bacterium]